MSDLISREALIEEIKENQCGWFSREMLLLMLENQPSVTGTNVGDKWISCSDKLPENRGNYLVCSKGIMWVANYFNYTWWGIEKRCRWGDIEAWMPLPEPYKGE